MQDKKHVVGKRIFDKYKQKFGEKAIFDWRVDSGTLDFKQPKGFGTYNTKTKLSDTPWSSIEELEKYEDKNLWKQQNYIEKEAIKEKASFRINVGHVSVPRTMKKYSRSKLREIARTVYRKYKKKYDSSCAGNYYNHPYWYWKITNFGGDVIYWYTEPWLIPSSSDVSLRKQMDEQRKYLFRELEKYDAVIENLPPGGNTKPGIWNSFLVKF